MSRLRFSEQFPDLFAGLPAARVRAVEQTLANGRLEGWNPDRETVADLIDYTLGRLTRTEYVARGSQRRASQIRVAH